MQEEGRQYCAYRYTGLVFADSGTLRLVTLGLFSVTLRLTGPSQTVEPESC